LGGFAHAENPFGVVEVPARVTDGAKAILKLRAIRANGDWDHYWTWHKLQEHHRTYRNHPNCYQLAA
jgi:hypothetical protein